jgi:hypothetical protein
MLDDAAIPDNAFLETWAHPDMVVTVYRPIPGCMDPLFLTVGLVAGDAPWATCHCGKVVTGPPHPDFKLTCCGVAETSLPWNDGDYWVMDAADEDGKDVVLTPAEHRDALNVAKDSPVFID